MLTTTHEQEMQARAAAELSVDPDTSWNELIRIYYCRRHGQNPETTWDTLWGVVWRRHLALPDNASKDELAACWARRHIRIRDDPLKSLMGAGALAPLGIDPDYALPCKGLMTTIKDIWHDYESWKCQNL